MFELLLLTLSLCSAPHLLPAPGPLATPCLANAGGPAPHAASAAGFGDDKAIKALDAWLRLYRAGKIDFRDKQPLRKDSIAAKYGIAPKNGLGNPTWSGDLKMILEAVAQLDTPEAAQALLEVAAIGIDHGRVTYKFEMAPYDVRAMGEEFTARLTTTAAKDEVAKAARGELKVDKDRAVAMRAAGVRCLGLLRDKSYRAAIEAALADTDEIVRVNAAEALANLGDEDGALALVGALERESSDAVLMTAAQSLRLLFAKYLTASPAPEAKEDKKPGEDKGAAPAAAADGGKDASPAPAPAAAGTPPESTRLAVRAAIKALGRTTWRADMALVRLLDDFRSIETVPALIAVLERFRDNPEDVKSGKLSGLLLYQAHELLVGMTGAVFPADQPDKWRELWERDKDKIEVTKKHDREGAPRTVASTFCGIPIQGTRVVFVLDLSGSMDWQMDEVTHDGNKKRSIRLDFAKQELGRAMDSIAPNAQFNLICFNGDEKADVWSKDLMPANEKNRERFRKKVNQLKALGGTNLWAGLEEALKMRSLVYGSHYESNVDEVFILSDGAPSVGEVTDPIEMLRLVQEGNRFANVRINTIFISSAMTAEQQRAQPKMSITPQELMKRMAEQNGGIFREL
ncbi:MAG TPA: HEAT repeat domain-containing protein [Planctomycetota bacterium]|nr:HEAT repeat domain-containing protein [Planctomycetota bacterium]